MPHLADDFAEIRQIAAQDVELVHAPKFVEDPARLFEQFDETGLVLPVVAKIVIDLFSCSATACGSYARRHADEFRILVP